jgi:putative ATP-binding cassette transporter
MSVSDQNTIGQSARLGEKLLKVIPAHKSGQNKPWVSNGELFARLQILGAADSLGFLALLVLLAALCGTGVLFLLNSEAKIVEQRSYSTLIAVLFAVLLVVYRMAQNRLIRTAAGSIEAALNEKRQRVVADVLKLSLRDIELIEAGRLRDGIAAHYGSLSQTLVPIIGGAEALVLLLFMFAYVLSLSVFAGALTIVVIGMTVAGYLNRSKAMEAELAASAAADARFRTLTDAIALGAKELQLGLRRRIGLEEAMRDSSTALAKGRSASAAHFADLISTGTTISYLLAGAVVFVMPLLSTQVDGDVSRVVIAVIFLLGPIGSVVQTAQQVTTAQYALNAINGFEADIAARQSIGADQSNSASDSISEAAEQEAFASISLTCVKYVHTGAQGFAISDIDLTLSKGEIVFLTGGNGSGKTTLLRVLTGLYPRASGAMLLNGRDVSELPPQSYRELFAAVFADFHLFDRPFGLDESEMSVFEVWLERLGIRDNLGDDLAELATKTLSTGQRKRVALALALAEARPVLVLDEWAADQDPETRKRFYEEILPALRADGRTIFAITHDEKYFHLCDRRLHMADGRLVQGDPQ